MNRLISFAAVAALVAGCGSAISTPTAVSGPVLASTPAHASPRLQSPTTEPSAATPPIASGRPGSSAPSIPGPAGFLKPCQDDPTTFCGHLDVPVDRANPGGEKINLALRLLPHTDTSQAALATVLSLPGGPGSAAGAGPGYQPGSGVIGEALVLRHDTLLIDPRGTGSSGAIDCPDLQDGFANDAEMQTAVAACAAQLGDNADRYGSGDIALDIEDVRATLGLDQVDVYGASYGTVYAQAYASRFPDRVHAIVLDSGLTLDDPVHYWGEGYPRAWLGIVARFCGGVPTCAANHPHPEAELAALIARIRKAPVRGSATGGDVLLDGAAFIGILSSVGPFPDNLGAETLLDAAAANAHGDNGPILELSQWATGWPGDNGDPTQYSEGMHAAATCNDDPMNGDPREPVADRAATLLAAVAALPKDAFEPFTVAEWVPSARMEYCLAWPVPDRYEPATRPRTTIAVPALVLAGEQDGVETSAVQHRLLDVFPNSTWAVVAGAIHSVLGWSRCPRDLMAEFLDTLRVDGGTCAP
jgi:pimeloyl-ACP methyl ester carboxylesterase